MERNYGHLFIYRKEKIVMTKNEFLNNLRRNLSGLPRDELEDKISFYEEMINDRMDEGKSEEQAVAEIGTTDEAVIKIASETKLSTLVKERIKPKRGLNGWEIALIILGFPVWFPILLTIFILGFVGYMLTWVLMLVTYSIELGLIGGFFSSLVAFLASFFAGNPQISMLGVCIALFGVACLFIFVCIPATKLSIGLSKRIFLGIKSKFIRGGSKNE